MWAAAVGPAVAAGIAVWFFGLKRTTVTLRSEHRAAPETRGPRDARRVDETCHWLRRLATTPVLRDAGALMLEKAAQKRLSSSLKGLEAASRGWIRSTNLRVGVTALTPELVPVTCEEEATGEAWIELEASCNCSGSVAVDLEFVMLPNLTLPLSLRISELRLAGAVARCHTRGKHAGNVTVVEVPDVSFELRTSLGHPEKRFALQDTAAIPYTIECFGPGRVRRLVGRVFADALGTLVDKLLPASLKG